MTKMVYTSLVGITLSAVWLTDPPSKLVGQWLPKLPGGVSFVTYYRPNETFDVFINGKTFVSGIYKVSHDTVSLSDPACGVGYYGRYKVAYMRSDSIRQTLIEDTCRARRSSPAHRLPMGRVKATKP